MRISNFLVMATAANYIAFTFAAPLEPNFVTDRIAVLHALDETSKSPVGRGCMGWLTAATAIGVDQSDMEDRFNEARKKGQMNTAESEKGDIAEVWLAQTKNPTEAHLQSWSSTFSGVGADPFTIFGAAAPPQPSLMPRSEPQSTPLLSATFDDGVSVGGSSSGHTNLPPLLDPKSPQDDLRSASQPRQPVLVPHHTQPVLFSHHTQPVLVPLHSQRLEPNRLPLSPPPPIRRPNKLQKKRPTSRPQSGPQAKTSLRGQIAAFFSFSKWRGPSKRPVQ